VTTRGRSPGGKDGDPTREKLLDAINGSFNPVLRLIKIAGQ
jgi:hypothetical protein